MSGIVIRTINGEFTGELDNGSIPDTVWLSLPKTVYIYMLASMIYFEFPLDCPIEGELVRAVQPYRVRDVGVIKFGLEVGGPCA